MSDDLEDLRRRLVAGRKRDGRCVYDAAAKAELVALCLQPGTSVSRLSRECGVNANQVSRWLREHAQGGRRLKSPSTRNVSSDFVQIPLLSHGTPTCPDSAPASGIGLQARLPNGVAIDLHGLQSVQIAAVIEALGRLPCSVSMKA